MATSNFYTQEHFNLFVFCPDVSDYDDYEEASIISGIMYDDFREQVQPELDKLNDGLIFHKVVLKSGYYEGIQFFVECEHELDKYNDYTDDDCYYYFDMNREDSYTGFNREIEMVNRQLGEIAKKCGMMQLAISARFSNGETWYKEVKEDAGASAQVA